MTGAVWLNRLSADVLLFTPISVEIMLELRVALCGTSHSAQCKSHNENRTTEDLFLRVILTEFYFIYRNTLLKLPLIFSQYIRTKSLGGETSEKKHGFCMNQHPGVYANCEAKFGKEPRGIRHNQH